MKTKTNPSSTTTDHAHALPGLLATVRDELRAKRAERAARKTLIRELASFTSPAERADLDATLSRYPDEDVADLRRLIAMTRHLAA